MTPRHATRITLLWLAGTAGAVRGHDGHSLTGSHWHATDTLGLLLAIIAIAAAVWYRGGGR